VLSSAEYFESFGHTAFGGDGHFLVVPFELFAIRLHFHDFFSAEEKHDVHSSHYVVFALIEFLAKSIFFGGKHL
jgi:hypothetical protein